MELLISRSRIFIEICTLMNIIKEADAGCRLRLDLRDVNIHFALDIFLN